MADAVLSRLGVVNAANPAGAEYTYEERTALFKDVFSGEVMNAFDETNVFRDLHMVRNIESGKSASFPATWKLGARYHKPGTPILGSQKLEIAERRIFVDDLLVSDVFIDDLEDAMLHYDVRQEHSGQIGKALAKQFDTNCSRVAINAARASATNTSGFGGASLYNAAALTDGEVLAGMLFSSAQTLDEKDVDEADRRGVFRPAQYYLMVQTTKLLNRDWGGEGSYADGSLPVVAGVGLVKSNNVPNTNVTAATAGENNDYTGDFRHVAGVVLNRKAIGTVSLLGLTTEMSGSDFHLMYSGTLLKASMAVGHGILRPECAVELATQAPI